MQLEFYIDVFFFINLFMNCILLFLVSKIRKQSIHILRLLMSAVTGALIACLSALMYKIPVLISFLFDYIATSLFMILIAFSKKSKRNFFYNYVTFLLCSFLLGGLLQSLSETFQAGNHLKGFFESVLHSRTKLTVLILLSVFLTPFLLYCYHLMKENSKVLSNLYDVEIMLREDKIIKCKGFLDTGNSLRDPLKNWPVIIADQNLLKDELCIIQSQYPTSLCIIPYVSVGKENGILYGIRVNCVNISNSHDRICTKNVVVALSQHGFANKGDYKVLLHSDLLDI